MTIPETFADRLHTRFNGRFRLRWSEVEHQYLLEQRVARGLAPGLMKFEFDNERKRKYQLEERIRQQDGYILTAVITAGTTAYCPRCESPTPSPRFEFQVSFCAPCASHGVEQLVHSGFFHFNDQLLEAIEEIDPHKDGVDRTIAKTIRHNEARERELEYQLMAPIEARFRDDFKRLVGIPGVGYTGRIFAGSDGPGTR